MYGFSPYYPLPNLFLAQVLMGDDDPANQFGFAWHYAQVTRRDAGRDTFRISWLHYDDDSHSEWPTAVIRALTPDKSPSSRYISTTGPARAFALTISATKSSKRFPFLVDQVLTYDCTCVPLHLLDVMREANAGPRTSGRPR